MKRNEIVVSDTLAFAKSLPDCSLHSIVTSPSYYGLRDYEVDGQVGLEPTPQEYIDRLVEIFREYRRVLRDDGTFWLNLGDSYANDSKWGGSSGGKNYTSTAGGYQGQRQKRNTGFKAKDAMMMPARLAIALCDDGWYLRDEIVWSKPNGMPASVEDRTTRSHEMIYMFSKKKHYWYDRIAIQQPAAPSSAPRAQRGISANHKNVNGAPGQTPHSILKPRPNVRKQDGVGKRQYTGFNARYDDNDPPSMVNCRSVWTIATVKGMEGHYATFPPKLAERMILAGTPHKTCSRCGAPWVRILERGFTDHNGKTESTYQKGSAANRLALLRQAARENGGEHTNQVRTVGWKPTCKCGISETVPGIVLDPFMGSGTVARVAVGLGRNYLGCDLNQSYVKKANDSLARGIQLPIMEVLQA